MFVRCHESPFILPSSSFPFLFHFIPSRSFLPTRVLFLHANALFVSFSASRSLSIHKAQIYHAHSLIQSTKQAHGDAIKFVSVCPAWVGTNIAGQGFEKHVIGALAFPPDQVRLCASWLHACMYCSSGEVCVCARIGRRCKGVRHFFC